MTKTIGLELAVKHVKNGILDIWGEFENKRKANCKICGEDIPKGEGIGAYFYAMKVGAARSRHLPKCRARRGKSCICEYRYQHVYVCKKCDNNILLLVQQKD